jgi:hypothetical protein
LKHIVSLPAALPRSQERVNTLSVHLDAANDENGKLRNIACDFGLFRNALGHEQTDTILQGAKAAELPDKAKSATRRKIERER